MARRGPLKKTESLAGSGHKVSLCVSFSLSVSKRKFDATDT